MNWTILEFERHRRDMVLDQLRLAGVTLFEPIVSCLHSAGRGPTNARLRIKYYSLMPGKVFMCAEPHQQRYVRYIPFCGVSKDYGELEIPGSQILKFQLALHQMNMAVEAAYERRMMPKKAKKRETLKLGDLQAMATQGPSLIDELVNRFCGPVEIASEAA